MIPLDGPQYAAELIQSQNKQPFFDTMKMHPSTPSETTEFVDTDFDSDSDYFLVGESPHKSAGSLVTDSVSTASTPDEIKTPDSTGLTGFHFHIDDNPVAGPTGPHLFRLSDDGKDQKQAHGIELVVNDTPISATTPRYHCASKLGPDRRDTPVPGNKPKQNIQGTKPDHEKPRADSVTSLDENPAARWTPQDVVAWMQGLDLDEGIIEKFFINDISGSILLELQSEDLKELEIHSFGKRHRLLSSIRQLRNSTSLSSRDSQNGTPCSQSDSVSRGESSTPESAVAVVGARASCSASPSTDDSKSSGKTKGHGHRRRTGRRRPQAIVPDESISIVAIEQLLPKLHTCSKGEDCRKWRKQQAKLARIARDFPADSLGAGASMALRGDPGNAPTAQNLAKTPKSDATPSIVASSDVLGSNQPEQPPLSQDKLNVVQPRDPQENVRNFINFQRLSRLQPVNDPATPPMENFPRPQETSPNSTKGNANLTENLRHLPKLRIPSTHQSTARLTPSNLSAQRTITPSVLKKKTSFPHQNITGQEKGTNAASSVFSPSEFYRQDPHYDQSTPLSEVDAPLTAVPLPIERVFSQSVPPDMRFGSHDPIARPRSTKAENHRRNASMQNANNFKVLRKLDEGAAISPIDTPEDLDKTPRAAHCRSNPFKPNGRHADNATHSGWMKKRKTSRFLRREWEENHFALRGTQLAMYPDEEASRRDSKALEHIDVDDYAVACSSLPSNSKLTAAFKKTVLKRKDNFNGDTAFAFSLIPSPNGGFDRKTLFLNGPKSHHFAVKSRDERIDWMRELMLAKALKRGRDSGDTLNMNGSVL